MRTKEWLTAKLKEESVTQKELANKAGLAIPTIAKIISGERFGSAETWNKIELVLDPNALNVSFASDEIIEELKEEIELYGPIKQCMVYYKVKNNYIIFTEYALEDDLVEYSIEDLKELNKLNKLQVTLMEALDLFENQNRII